MWGHRLGKSSFALRLPHQSFSTPWGSPWPRPSSIGSAATSRAMPQAGSGSTVLCSSANASPCISCEPSHDNSYRPPPSSPAAFYRRGSSIHHTSRLWACQPHRLPQGTWHSTLIRRHMGPHQQPVCRHPPKPHLRNRTPRDPWPWTPNRQRPHRTCRTPRPRRGPRGSPRAQKTTAASNAIPPSPLPCLHQAPRRPRATSSPGDPSLAAVPA